MRTSEMNSRGVEFQVFESLSFPSTVNHREIREPAVPRTLSVTTAECTRPYDPTRGWRIAPFNCSAASERLQEFVGTCDGWWYCPRW